MKAPTDVQRGTKISSAPSRALLPEDIHNAQRPERAQKAATVEARAYEPVLVAHTPAPERSMGRGIGISM
ncbi:hypothetical protein GCM10027066_07350 [Dyella jejuensis]